MTLPKLTIIGAGQVGATVAHLAMLRSLGNLVLIDVVDGLAAGKALDLLQAAAVEDQAVNVTGTTDWNAIAGSDVVVVTAGLARKPGMSREDLLTANANIVGPIAETIARTAPHAIVIVVTNPLDVMTHLVLKRTGFPRERVLGMAGVLDTGRFRAFVAQELGVHPKSVSAMVLGSHGDLMVPSVNTLTIEGKRGTQVLETATLQRLVDRTRNGGAEIVALLKTGSAYYAPASSVVQMLQAILRDERRVLPCAVLLDGEYGLKDVCIGVPVELGAGGVRRIVDLALSVEDAKALHAAAEQVRSGTQHILTAASK